MIDFLVDIVGEFFGDVIKDVIVDYVKDECKPRWRRFLVLTPLYLVGGAIIWYGSRWWQRDTWLTVLSIGLAAIFLVPGVYLTRYIVRPLRK